MFVCWVAANGKISLGVRFKRQRLPITILNPYHPRELRHLKPLKTKRKCKVLLLYLRHDLQKVSIICRERLWDLPLVDFSNLQELVVVRPSCKKDHLLSHHYRHVPGQLQTCWVALGDVLHVEIIVVEDLQLSALHHSALEAKREVVLDLAFSVGFPEEDLAVSVVALT